MVQKKRVAAKIKSKPTKVKAVKKSKVTLESIQLTLNQVVDKLGHHDQRFEKIETKIDKMDLGVAKVRVLYENEMKPLSQSIFEKVESLESRIGSKLEDHETRITNLESHSQPV